MRATRHFHLSDLIFLKFFGGSRDSVVSIAIRYKLDGPAFESQQRQDVFSSPITRKVISPRNVDVIAFDHLTRLLDRESFIGDFLFSQTVQTGSAVHKSSNKTSAELFFQRGKAAEARS
jgi:hypothetical protein